MQAQPVTPAPDDGTTMTLEGDCDIVITRSFRAPASAVYRVLTEREFIMRWWAPCSRARLEVCEVDARVGGKWRYVMRLARDDSTVAFFGEYLTLQPGKRLVYTEAIEYFPDAPSTVTVTLEERGGETLMVQRASYPSAEVRSTVIATGMEHGMRESMQQLTAVVDELAAAR